LSYALQVWTTAPFEDASTLPDSGWVETNGSWSKGGKGWLVNVSANQEVLAEDIPEDINGALPGIRFLTELSLEPIHAPKSARALLRRVAQSIAKAAHGVVFDPQQDALELPSGVKRFSTAAREERIAMLSLSWWFTHDDLTHRDGIERLLRALESEVREVLPRRYGLYEPPQFELEKMGRPHLVEFLERHAQETVVWYAHRPVMGVYLGVRSPSRWQPLGKSKQYRCQRFSIDVERSALAQPGWPTALRRLWRRVSRELRPFYGEVRTLRGYLRSGARVALDRETEHNPTKAWWWKGIPSTVGHAFVVGPPYVDLWPELAAGGVIADGALRLVETPDWTKDEEASAFVGGVPAPLASREHTTAALSWPEPVYPAVFPFPRDEA